MIFKKKRIALFLLIIALLFKKGSVTTYAQDYFNLENNYQNASKKNFITIVNPVRSREFWKDKSIDNLKNQAGILNGRGLPATWLLSYDNLNDQEIVVFLKSDKANQEIGAFLEVGENWATDAGVSYIIGEGDYYRPDKIYLSGYSKEDRKKLLKTYFDKFYKVFKAKPKSAGAWYLDPVTLDFLSKQKVESVLTVSDQYDTDAVGIWGKYYSMPYYPSRFNSLEPANSEKNKIPIVNIQWAQRDLIGGYGKEIRNSRESFQANDYLNNGNDSSYFDRILQNYIQNDHNDFIQITIGLETGQEAASFAIEFEKQIDRIDKLQKEQKIEVMTMSDFAIWYKNKYPHLSPSHFLQKEENFWYMSPQFRIGVFKEGTGYAIKDFRFYNNYPFPDYLYADKKYPLFRRLLGQVDAVSKNNDLKITEVENVLVKETFDRLDLKFDNKVIEIDHSSFNMDGREIYKNDTWNFQRKLTLLGVINSSKDKFSQILDFIKYSKIGGKRVIGIALMKNKLLGVKGIVPGIYTFDFQTFSKFLTLSYKLNKWQPWLN